MDPEFVGCEPPVVAFRPITIFTSIRDILLGAGWEVDRFGRSFKNKNVTKSMKLKVSRLDEKARMTLIIDFYDGRRRILFTTVNTEMEFMSFCLKNDV